MSNSSDPERGGQQPDDRSREGRPDGGAAVPQPGAPDPAAQGPGAPGPDDRPGQYQQPGQYQPGQYPQSGPYGQPGQYGQPQYPATSYGAPYGDRGGYTYTPYGTYPAGMPEDDQPQRSARPGIMILALVLLILSTLPFLLLGFVPLVLPSDLSQLPPDLAAQIEQQLAANQLTYEQVRTAFGLLAGLFVVLALVYIAFAVVAFRGHGWARIALTIMTAGFALFMLLALVQAPDPASTVLLLLVVGAAVVGTVILFLPEPSRWITTPRP